MQSTLGLLVPGRCKATNLCQYCARLVAVENAEVLAQDALANSAPTIWTVLGTRTPTIDTDRFRNARSMVRRDVRKRWPDAEAATMIEFTTGYGANSGGLRRPHWNDTWKGVPLDDIEELHAVMLRPWLRNVDATAKAHSFERCVRPIHEMGGLMRYLALHFQKESQQPPAGWKGHRFRTSRGYLAETMPEARERAREALRYRRELWKLEQQYELAGIEISAEDLDAQAQAAVAAAAAIDWELVREAQLPATWDESTGRPATFTQEWFPVRPA